MEALHFANGEVQRLAYPALPAEGYLWLDYARDQDAEWAAEVAALTGVTLDERHIRDAENAGHAAALEEVPQYQMLILRGLAPEANASQFSSRATALIRIDRVLVTVRPPDSRSIPELQQRLLTHTRRPPQSVLDLVHAIANNLVDRFLALREPLNEAMDYWERRLLSDQAATDDWRNLLGYRRELRRLGSLCEEQLDALEAWRRQVLPDDSHGVGVMVRYRDLIEHVRRVLRHVRQLEHDQNALIQLHFSAVTERTNTVMKILTVIAAVFLPLTFIAGIYGMNFEHMPELEHPYAYYAVLGLMAAVAGGLVLLFRWQRWL